MTSVGTVGFEVTEAAGAFRALHAQDSGTGPPGLRKLPGVLGAPCSYCAWRIRIFQARGAPKTTPRKPPRPRSLGLGFPNNVNHRKGEGVPQAGLLPQHLEVQLTL